MSAPSALFRFVQVELPWPLGPPDGRYLMRLDPTPARTPTHVIVFATLGAAERRRLAGRRPSRVAPAAPAPAPVSTGRATVIDVAEEIPDTGSAKAWLRQAGEGELAEGLRVLNWALRGFRVVSEDPYLQPVGRHQLIMARVGFGAGEQVADGLWSEARELAPPARRQRRARVLESQSRLAAVLGGRMPVLACEELALRARLDLDQGHEREAALQVLVALDAALAELSTDRATAALSARLDELRGQRQAATAAAQSALEGSLADGERETVAFTLARIEAALRARAVQGELS